jgi:hypothetical protein
MKGKGKEEVDGGLKGESRRRERKRIDEVDRSERQIIQSYLMCQCVCTWMIA